MAFCQKCGAELAEGAAFCISCGEAVGTAGTRLKHETVNATIKKCPNCGEMIPNGLVTKCPSCGFEFEKNEISKGIKTLVDELKENPYRTKEIVENYVVPNNKEDMIEFILFATARGSEELEKAKRSDTPHNNFRDTSFYAFAEKAIATIEKANMLFSNDTSFLDSLNPKKAELNSLKQEMSTLISKSKKKADTKYAVKSTMDKVKDIFTVILPFIIPILGAIFVIVATIMEGGIYNGTQYTGIGKLGVGLIVCWIEYKIVKAMMPKWMIITAGIILFYVWFFLCIEL